MDRKMIGDDCELCVIDLNEQRSYMYVYVCI